MRDLIFKINRNLLPSFRGLYQYLFSLLNPKVQIDKAIRIGKGSEFIFHPRCQFRVKAGFKCGRYATIAVLSTGYLEIGKDVGIGNFNQIICHNHISIGDHTIFGPNVMVYDHNHQFSFETGVKRRNYDVSEINIGKNCWIGAGSIILKGINIGDNCIIGAGSIVTKSIPDRCVVAGNPAKIIKQIEHTIVSDKKIESI